MRDRQCDIDDCDNKMHGEYYWAHVRALSSSAVATETFGLHLCEDHGYLLVKSPVMDRIMTRANDQPVEPGDVVVWRGMSNLKPWELLINSVWGRSSGGWWGKHAR